MCKYCKFRTVGEIEKTNDSQTIYKMVDGSQIFELYLNRSESDNHHSSELVMDYAIKIRDFAYSVKSKEIPIKYCPFCGEEL